MRRDRKYILCIMMMVLLLSGFQNVVFAETDGVEQVESVFLETPIVTVSNVTDTGKPRLTWNEIPGADCYAVYRAFSVDGNYEQKAIVSESSWTHSGAVAGIGYFYKVQALSTGEPETNSAFSDAQFGICNFKRPVCKVDLNKIGKPVLTWKAVQNAKGYEVYSAMAQDGSYKRIATVTTNTYTHETAKYHKNYFYKIKAIDEEKPQASSAESKVCVIYTIDLRKKLVALTFDDGPGPYTKQIVNCLRKHDGRATFFLLGQRVKTKAQPRLSAYSCSRARVRAAL